MLFDSLLQLGDKDTSITQSPQVVQIPIGFETGSDDGTSLDSDSDFTTTSSDDVSHDLHTHTGSNLSQPERKWCLIHSNNCIDTYSITHLKIDSTRVTPLETRLLVRNESTLSIDDSLDLPARERKKLVGGVACALS